MHSDSSTPPRARRWPLFLLALLLINSLALAVAARLPSPPRSMPAALLHGAGVFLHVGLGLFVLLATVAAAKAWVRAVLRTHGLARVLGFLALLALVGALVSGVWLAIAGNVRANAGILRAHGAASLISAVAGALWFALRARSAAMEADGAPLAARFRTASLVIVGLLVPGFALMAYAARQVSVESRIVNPPLPPMSMDEEGDGPNGKFWPSSLQTVGQRFIPPEFFTDNATCGQKGCHPDIYQQWQDSVHHLGSFNNQFYRKSIEYMQEVVGPKASKWCGGCHDMAILQTEMPGTGKSRMDFPIKDQIWPPEKNKEAHTGISCSACHSMVHVKSTMGNADYVLDYPPMHRLALSKHPLIEPAMKFLTHLSPGPHKKTFLKPFHREDSSKFCSACHKVHLDKPVNNFRWFRGFNDYDPWQASGVSGQGARSFYYPSDKDGKPAFKECVDCHMPLTPSKDAGNIDGKVHSHRFLAANTAVPFINGRHEQFRLTQEFLRDGQISVDIFALRREKPTAGPVPAPRPARPGLREENQPKSASLFGEEATTGHSTMQAASLGPVNEDIIAPINRGAVAVRRGEEVLIDVVVRTRKIGHAFPGGTFDAFDVWVELKAEDDRGKTLFWSGALQWPDGPVDPSAHQYRALLVDGGSNEINKRNAWAARARVYARAIPPGAADTVRYRLKIPKDAGNRIRLTAKVNYRKFAWYGTWFSFVGRPDDPSNPMYSVHGLYEGVAVGMDPKTGKSKTSGPVTADYDNRNFKWDASMKVASSKPEMKQRVPALPTTVMAEDSAELVVVSADPGAATAPRKLELGTDRVRWNDYGIGFMLQGDLARATKAFKQVIALSPDWPEGYVNLGRARFNEGDLKEARANIEKALSMYAAKPTPMTPYLAARTKFFYGMALKNAGEYDQALKVWREAAQVFPDDRELRNQTGRVLFQYGATDPSRFQEAIREFKHVLTIDPEDLTAHYNLMLCYRAVGDKKQEEIHRKLFHRFKDDESTTHLAGPFKRKSPHDNHESNPIHEHASGPPPMKAPPAWVQQLYKKQEQDARGLREVRLPGRKG